MTAVKTFTHNGYNVEIIPDDSPSSPDEMEGSIFIITTRNRYFEQQRGGFELDAARDGEYDAEYHVYPLYMYQHSGTALSLKPFTCPWDSGQVGFVLAKRSDFTGDVEAWKCTEGYIESWNQYLSGDVYGYRLETPEGDVADSCWGFYGLDYAVQSAKEAADALPACPVGGESEDKAHEETLA